MKRVWNAIVWVSPAIQATGALGAFVSGYGWLMWVTPRLNRLQSCLDHSAPGCPDTHALHNQLLDMRLLSVISAILFGAFIVTMVVGFVASIVRAVRIRRVEKWVEENYGIKRS